MNHLEKYGLHGSANISLHATKTIVAVLIVSPVERNVTAWVSAAHYRESLRPFSLHPPSFKPF